MSTDIVLNEKREELKRQLAAGEYKTLVDICLAWFERLLRKITRRSRPLPLWVVTVIFYIVIQLIVYAVILIAGDWGEYHKLTETLGVGYEIGFLINIAIGILFVISMIIINQYIGRLVVLWRDSLLDITESEASLKEFNDWLKKTCDWRLHLLAIIIPNIILDPFGFKLIGILLGISSYSLLFSTIVVDLIGWAILYQLLMVILLSVKLRRYDLKLFAADPASSEIISRLSGELGFFVYYIAIFAAIVTLAFSAQGLLPILGVGLVLVLWLPLIILFILNQTSLSNIIRRAKWKTLNEIQARVEKLQETENYSDKETMEAISRLMEYHNSVKSTRNSAVDLGTALNFINSLLLPLIAFILGNLDLLKTFLAKLP